MKSKKKIKTILTVSIPCAVLVIISLFLWSVHMNIRADELTKLDNWQRNVTYSMLSKRIKDVISKEEFNDRTDTGRYNMYRKLEGLEIVPKAEDDPSTDWWKTPPFDYVETDEGNFLIELRIDFKVHLTRIEVINFVPYIYSDD